MLPHHLWCCAVAKAARLDLYALIAFELFRLDERSQMSLNACLRLPHRPEMTVLQSQTAYRYLRSTN